MLKELRAHKLACQLRQASARALLTEAQRTDTEGRTTSPLAPYKAIYARIAADYDVVIASVDKQLAALKEARHAPAE